MVEPKIVSSFISFVNNNCCCNQYNEQKQNSLVLCYNFHFLPMMIHRALSTRPLICAEEQMKHQRYGTFEMAQVNFFWLEFFRLFRSRSLIILRRSSHIFTYRTNQKQQNVDAMYVILIPNNCLYFVHRSFECVQRSTFALVG